MNTCPCQTAGWSLQLFAGAPAAAPLNWRFVERAENKTQPDKVGGGWREEALEDNLFPSLRQSRQDDKDDPPSNPQVPS